jgi:hypothetical protein
MPILSSPGVAVVEKDYSQVVTFNASNNGVIVGDFLKGPIRQPILIDSATKLEKVFGRPTNANAGRWFTAFNFLQYTNSLWAIRAAPTGVKAATVTAGGTSTILNEEEYENADDAATFGQWICKSPGAMGNNIMVVSVDAGNYSDFTTWQSTFETSIQGFKPFTSYLKNTGTPSTTTYVYNRVTGDENTRNAKADELHIFVIDVTGKIAGHPMSLLEVFESTSKAADARNVDGTSNYYVDVVNSRSEWVYWGTAPASGVLTSGANEVAWGTYISDLEGTTPKTFKMFDTTDEFVGAGALRLVDGADGTTPDDAAVIAGYNTVANPEEFSFTFIMTADYGITVVNHCIDNIAVNRRDCLVFISPKDTNGPFLDKTTMVTDIIDYRNTVNANSYAVMDSGYKWQFDVYNQKYRWVPLNGDIAGLCARTDSESEPWYSPAGYNRGQIKNVSKLSTNPSQADRDELYQNGINPVVTFPGSGTILFGDKTLQKKASAFDHINVRRLFIILEKSISDAAKYQLFELNDPFTRAQFRALVDPFLRTVKGRRGIEDFRVVCDESNNTEEVVARNEFVADIYIKPLYSINYIILNFVAVKSVVQFNQIGG